MKKLLLIIVILPFLSFGQTVKTAVNNNNLGVDPVFQVPFKVVGDISPNPASLLEAREASEYNKSSNRSAKYTSVKIGESQYALQTNASVARRIVVYADGKKSAVWTTSKDQTPYQTRGTGYNHYNGSAWFHSVQTRLEANRAGWPNIGKVNKNGTDVEFIMSHYASSVSTDPSGGIIINTNTGIGSITWQQKFLDQASGPIWHRTAECGDNVCIISTYSDTGKYVKGMRMPTVYSRYKVSKDTFDQKYVFLPGYDTSLFKSGSADDYAIDANGKTVAIVFAPFSNHVVLWKSTDSGATFTRTIIDTFSVPKPKFEGDTQYYNYPDGSVSVIVDNEGYCKVVWAYYTGFKCTNLDDSSKYWPPNHGLYFWNEKTGSKAIIPTAKVWDRNGNGLLDVYNGWFKTRVVSGARYYYTRYGSTNNLLSFPQLTIDNANNIFVIFSAVVENTFFFTDFDDVSGDSIKENLRDVYVVYSQDQGLTWGKSQNITNNPLKEDAFASVAKNCYGDKLHIIYQEDDDPGTDVQNYDPATVNDEYYVEVPISDILNELIGPGDSIAKVGINDHSSSFKIGNNYPNPFSGETYVDIQLNNSSNVSVIMNDMLGQEVLENTYTNVPSGKSTLSIDASGLQAGIYFLNVKVGNNVKTIKTIIQ
jgi:hypothetical protein